MKAVLIAELDTDGQIDCVWEWRKSPRSIRPLTEERRRKINLRDYEVSGVSAQDISDWAASARA
jgi:hypothetical protein